MKKYRNFIFEKYGFDLKSGRAFFNYSLDGKIKFRETLEIADKRILGLIENFKIKAEFIDRALFNIHLAGGIHYWKAYCPKKIIIKSGALSRNQADFWNNLYYQGMSQFYFENQLNPDKTAPEFPYDKKIVIKNDSGVDFRDKSLLLWGGGKDSIVSAEIFKKIKEDFNLFYIGDSAPQAATAKLVGRPAIKIKRILSPNLKNLKGVYNGHVPITAYNSFIAVLIVVLFDFNKIILSNEKSASFGNLFWRGLEVNHQYSKSFEFENKMANYVSNFITPRIKYFSLLRGFYELKISQIFSRYPKYFQAFASCNVNFKLNKNKRLKNSNWCGQCPKCAFVFLTLAAFLPRSILLNIFKKDLFDIRSLEETFLELLGLKKFKPLECVGTPEESKLALLKVIERAEFAGSYFIRKIAPEILKQKHSIQKTENDIMKHYNKDLSPNNFKEVLRRL
jgi:hypothetical protein